MSRSSQADSEGVLQAAWVETAHLKVRQVCMFYKRKTVISLDGMS